MDWHLASEPPPLTEGDQEGNPTRSHDVLLWIRDYMLEEGYQYQFLVGYAYGPGHVDATSSGWWWLYGPDWHDEIEVLEWVEIVGHERG